MCNNFEASLSKNNWNTLLWRICTFWTKNIFFLKYQNLNKKGRRWHYSWIVKIKLPIIIYLWFFFGQWRKELRIFMIQQKIIQNSNNVSLESMFKKILIFSVSQIGTTIIAWNASHLKITRNKSAYIMMKLNKLLTTLEHNVGWLRFCHGNLPTIQIAWCSLHSKAIFFHNWIFPTQKTRINILYNDEFFCF